MRQDAAERAGPGVEAAELRHGGLRPAGREPGAREGEAGGEEHGAIRAHVGPEVRVLEAFPLPGPGDASV